MSQDLMFSLQLGWWIGLGVVALVKGPRLLFDWIWRRPEDDL